MAEINTKATSCDKSYVRENVLQVVGDTKLFDLISWIQNMARNGKYYERERVHEWYMFGTNTKEIEGCKL